MNTIHHHPEESSLAGYAAGSLPAALALVIGCHLEACPRCRSVVNDAENLGGVLLDGLVPTPLATGAREALLARLVDGDCEDRTEAAATGSPSHAMPAKLNRLLGGQDLAALGWRRAGPGVRVLSLDCAEGKAILLKVDPGRAMPVHSHRGTELTMILEGAYDDSLGHFGPGDVADLDARIEHQPVAGPDGCLCLAGMDAPLRFRAWLPRLLQPVIGL